MKKIRSFESTARGFFIHLTDADIALSVTPNEGTVLLHEGAGKERVNGFCIPGENIISFELEPDLFAGMRVHLRYKARKRTIERTHFIGETNDVEGAERWTREVNKIYTPEYRAMRKKQLLESALSTTPLDQTLVATLALQGIHTCGELITATSQKLIAVGQERSGEILEIRNMLVRSASGL